MTRIGARAEEALSAFVLVVRNGHLRLVALARIASVTGRWGASVALAVVAYRWHGAQGVGLLGICRILPSALAGPLAAALLGRMFSDRLLLITGVMRTLAIAGAGFVLEGSMSIWIAFALVGIESLLSTMVRPLQTAALPFLSKTPLELTAANLSLTTIESLGMLLGPAISGGLMAVWPPSSVLFVTAGAYAFSTVIISRIPSWESASRATHVADAIAETLRGLRAIHQDSRLRLVVGLYCAENLVVGALNVLVVVTALRLLGLGNSGVGLLNGAIGAGGVVGALAAASVLGRGRIAASLGFGLFFCGLPILLVSAAPDTGVAMALLALLGVGITIVDFAAITLLQRAIEGPVLAQVFSVLQSVFVGTVGLGAAVAPLLVSLLGIRGALIGTGILLPVLATVLWRPLVALDHGEQIPAELIELLGHISFFAPIDLPTRERIARSLSPLEVPAGQAVVVEGEVPGDLYYVIAEGELEVSIAGQFIRVLEKGDGFGEIALLRDIPRTSTVTARTPCRLLTLDRETFLDVVGGNASSRNAADALVDMRLGSFRTSLASV